MYSLSQNAEPVPHLMVSICDLPKTATASSLKGSIFPSFFKSTKAVKHSNDVFHRSACLNVVNGVEYTSGTVSINATSTVLLKAYGVNLKNASYIDNKIEYKNGNVMPMGSIYGWSASEDGTTATKQISPLEFNNVHIPFTLKYSNKAGTGYIDSNVSIVYSSDANAIIYGISITVDGVEYTSGDVLIYSDSNVVVDVDGNVQIKMEFDKIDLRTEFNDTYFDLNSILSYKRMEGELRIKYAF